MANSVFTIGHSNHSLEQFLELLRQHKITAIADVRSVPYSRIQPQFNRESLKDFLNQSGIEYVFLGKELGARTEDRSCYEKGKVKYRRLAQTKLFKAGLERIRQGAEKYHIALMCAERDPLDCHRTLLVARELEAADTPVTHIRADGSLESHSNAEERLLSLAGFSGTDLFLSKSDLVELAYAKQEQHIAYVEENAAGDAKEIVS